MTAESHIDNVVTVEHALAHIGYVRQNIALLGRNDNEFARLDEIQQKLEAGQCTPIEAIDLANEVEASKQQH